MNTARVAGGLRWLWLGLLLLCGGVAHAAFPVGVVAEYSSSYGGTRVSSPGAACAQWVGYEPGYGYLLTGVASTGEPGSTGCIMNVSYAGAPSGTSAQWLWYFEVAGTCPAHSTGTSSCSCSAGYFQSGSTAGSVCYSNSDKLVDELNNRADSRIMVGGGTPSLTVCYEGHLMRGTSAAANYDGKSAVIWGPYTDTGTSCTGGDGTRQPDITSTDCASGTYAGTVNGVPMCVPKIPTNVTATGPTITASGMAGTASAPSSMIPNAPPTATSSQDSTSCTNGQCTTTTEYKNSGGTVVGTVQKAEGIGDWCAKNPGSAMCKGIDDPCVKDATGIGCAKLDTVTGAAIPTRTETLSFTAETPFGDGSCPADVMMTVGTLGSSMKMWDWQKTCAVALPLRALIIALATFTAITIVMPARGVA